MITLENEHIAHHHLQDDFILTAKIDGKFAGMLEYSIYDGEVSIQIVEVPVEYRRKGVATAMFEWLMKEYDVLWEDIDHGYQTLSGKLMHRSLTKKFATPNYEGRLLKSLFPWSALRDIANEIIELKGIEIDENPMDAISDLADVLEQIRYNKDLGKDMDAAIHSVAADLTQHPKVMEFLKGLLKEHRLFQESVEDVLEELYGYHWTTKDRLPSIMKHGLKMGSAVNFTLSHAMIEKVYDGQRPIFLSIDPYLFSRAVEDGVLLKIDIEGLKMVVDIPSLRDHGAEYDVDDDVIYWEPGTEPFELEDALGEDAEVNRKYLIDPSYEYLDAFVLFTGSMAVMEDIPIEKIEVIK